MKKRRFSLNAFVTIMAFLVMAIHVSAQPFRPWKERNILQGIMNIDQLQDALIKYQNWVRYPAYNDRTAWDALTGSLKENIIHNGENFLDYQWQLIKATDYLELERSGSRTIMEKPFCENNIALGHLVMAELAEGKGRFMDQIINGIWIACDMSSWVFSAHLRGYQASKRVLPDPGEAHIDHAAADLGALLSWTWFFLKDEMDKADPLISGRLRDELQKRILDPYMSINHYRWMAFNVIPGTTLVNNWTPWCNVNILTIFLLLENDPEMLAKSVYRTMISNDKFINYYHEDGASEEGCSYWGLAAGKLYEYLRILYDATGGKLSIFNEPVIKNMGEYMSRSYIGDGWFVNFGDASARGAGPKGVIYGYGEKTGSQEMKELASHMHHYLPDANYSNDSRFTRKELLERGLLFRDWHIGYNSSGLDLFQNLEYLVSHQAIVNTISDPPETPISWYSGTELCYMRNTNGFYFASKGGYNDESHNHNDCGSFLLFLDNKPVFIDVGIGDYTAQTFTAGGRYKIPWTQSNYHNLPVINGEAQEYGGQYRSKDVKFDEKNLRFSLDISGAYKAESGVKSWVRSYTLQPKGGLIIEDRFLLNETKEPNRINFMTLAKPDIASPGIVILETNGRKVQLTYDNKLFEPMIESIALERRLSNTWGNHELHRLTLLARKKQMRGNYKFTVNTL